MFGKLIKKNYREAKTTAAVAVKTVAIHCPRCDRLYSRKDGETHTELLNRVKDHVSEQHPDHDPQWFDTYPDHED